MTSHLTLRQRAAQYWNRNLTGWTAHSPTAAAISQGTASAGPTSPWPVYWLFLPDPRKCRYIGRCLFPALSLPTANAGAIGRWCAGSSYIPSTPPTEACRSLTESYSMRRRYLGENHERRPSTATALHPGERNREGSGG